jgi:hypothetical protein
LTSQVAPDGNLAGANAGNYGEPAVASAAGRGVGTFTPVIGSREQGYFSLWPAAARIWEPAANRSAKTRRRGRQATGVAIISNLRGTDEASSRVPARRRLA